MAIRLPFFGLISSRSPLSGLLEHYEQVSKAMVLIEEAMECYIADSSGLGCKEFEALRGELDAVEEHADLVTRNLRNHVPRSLFLPVDKHIFFLYTRSQDDILDFGQASVQWLGMRNVVVPEIFHRDLIFFLSEALKTVAVLRPALEITVDWMSSETISRETAKQAFWAVRKEHKVVTRMRQSIVPAIYSSDLDFKDIYQLIHCMDQLQNMSRSAVNCADLLRVMIAK